MLKKKHSTVVFCELIYCSRVWSLWSLFGILLYFTAAPNNFTQTLRLQFVRQRKTLILIQLLSGFVQNPRVWCPLLTEKMTKFWKEVENLGTDCQLNPSKNEKTECFQVSLALPEESWWTRFIGKDNWILVSCLPNNKRLIEIGSEFLFCWKSVRHPSKSINQKSHSAV